VSILCFSHVGARALSTGPSGVDDGAGESGCRTDNRPAHSRRQRGVMRCRERGVRPRQRLLGKKAASGELSQHDRQS